MKIYDNGKEVFNPDKHIWSMIDNFKLRMENLLLHDLFDHLTFNISDWEEFNTIQALICKGDNFIQFNLNMDMEVQLCDLYLNDDDYKVLHHLVYEVGGNKGFQTNQLWIISGVNF